MVRTVVNNARMGGPQVVRPWFGASARPVTADLAEGLGLDRPGGVLVNRLYPDGPAEGRAHPSATCCWRSTASRSPISRTP